MKPKVTPLDEVFARFENDEQFKRETRRLKPYYDLVLEIIRRRTELGLTQQELAEKSNMYQSRISKIEAAEHDLRLSTLIKIAEALDTEVSIHLLPIAKPIPIAEDAQALAFFKGSVKVGKPTIVQTFSEGQTSELHVKANYI